MPKNPLLTATTAEEMLKILTGDEYAHAMRLHRWAESAGLIIQPRTGANYYRIQYSTKKPKRSLFTIECNEKRWRVKSSLYHFARYSNSVTLSESLKQSIVATRRCTECNSRCVKGARFSLDGKYYFSCIGSGHFFEGLKSEDWDLYVKLLKQESQMLVNQT